MSKYYGETVGYNSKGTGSVASRCGHTGIRSSAQSWDGSVIAVIRDDKEGNPIFEIEITDESSIYGDTVFSGTIEELKEALEAYDTMKTGDDYSWGERDS